MKGITFGLISILLWNLAIYLHYEGALYWVAIGLAGIITGWLGAGYDSATKSNGGK